jgi:hypothetical protein
MVADDDITAWGSTEPDDLWVYDKLILSKKLGYVCGPAGVPVPRPGEYVVRPITNLLGMGLGAYVTALTDTTTHLQPGLFWCERFTGHHLTYDFIGGDLAVCYEGIASSPTRFSKWVRVDSPEFDLPESLQQIAAKYRHINIEVVGGKIIEVHLRGNPDWIKHRADVLIPVWREDNNQTPPSGFEFVEDPAEDRIGFFVPVTDLRSSVG